LDLANFQSARFTSPACGGRSDRIEDAIRVGGSSLHTGSVNRGDTPTPTLPRKRGRGSAIPLRPPIYGSNRLARARPNHFRNIASVSIISVKPAWLIFTVETIDGGPDWVWP
jgi:hypothetical protein